jgi:hypothetical protein
VKGSAATGGVISETVWPAAVSAATVVAMARLMAGVGGTTPGDGQLCISVYVDNHTICRHQSDAQLFCLRFLLLFVPPSDGMDGVVILPWLHGDDRSRKVSEIVQCPGHWAKDTGHSFLARHAGADTCLGPAACTAPQGVDTAPGCRNAHRSRNIGPNTDTTPKGKQSTLASG